jgi:hypothetical protein
MPPSSPKSCGRATVPPSQCVGAAGAALRWGDDARADPPPLTDRGGGSATHPGPTRVWFPRTSSNPPPRPPARSIRTAAPGCVESGCPLVEACGGASGREAARGTRNAVIAATISVATTAATASTRVNGLPRFVGWRRGANSLGASSTIEPSVLHVRGSWPAATSVACRCERRAGNVAGAGPALLAGATGATPGSMRRTSRRQ